MSSEKNQCALRDVQDGIESSLSVAVLACANRAHNLTESKKRAGVAQSYSTLDRSKN